MHLVDNALFPNKCSSITCFYWCKNEWIGVPGILYQVLQQENVESTGALWEAGMISSI